MRCCRHDLIRARILLAVLLLVSGALEGCKRRLSPREHAALMVHFHKLESQRCRRAIAAHVDGALRISGRRATISEFHEYGVFVGSCRDVFRRPLCRRAWDISQFVWTPARRVRVLLEGCRRAYCPVLSTPKPEFCDTSTSADEPTPDSKRALRLMVAALEFETKIKLSPAVIVKLSDALGLSGPIGSVAREYGEPVALQVSKTRGAIKIQADLAVQRWQLPANPTDADYQRLKAGLVLLRLASGDVDASISFYPAFLGKVGPRIVAILREVGFSRVTTGVILVKRETE